MILFILIFLVGYLSISLISKESKFFERIFLSMPIGLGFTSIIMFLYNVIVGAFTTQSILISNVIFILILLALLFWKKELNKNLIDFNLQKGLSQWNLWAIAFISMTAYLVYGITLKCLYYPPITTDSIQGYDLLAKAIAYEGKILNSILLDKNMVESCGPRLLYPPLLACSNALCYIQGMDAPKYINTFFYLSWAGAFFTLLSRLTNVTSAAFFTFMTIIIPEMFAHGSFELTNLPTAYFAVMSVLCIMIWYKENITSYLYLATILSAFMLWTRNDSVFIFLGIQAAIFLLNFKAKNFKANFIYGISLLTFITWMFYSKYNVPKTLDSIFINHLFYDADKLSKVVDRCWNIITTKNLFGITTQLFLFVLFIHVYAIYKRRDNWFLLTIIFVSLLSYSLVFYQVDDKDGFLFFENGGWLDSGYKRGLFSYLPMFFVYIALSEYVKKVFDFLHEKLMFGKEK